MALSVSSNDSDGCNGGNGSANIAANIAGNASVPSINGASNVYNRHHNQPPPAPDPHWQNAQLSSATSPPPWTNFGTDNRARAASNPNPGQGSSRRPSLRLHINQYQPQQPQYQQQQTQAQYQHHPGQQSQYPSQGHAMSVIPAPVPPPPRPDFMIGQGHPNPALLAKQPQHYQPFNPQPDRRLPLPHVPAATNHQRVPDLHTQNNSRSPSPRNTATTATPSTGVAFVPSPFGGPQGTTPVRGMSMGSAGGSTPSTGSSNSSKRSAGFHGQLPFSTPSGSTSSPNLNSTLPVVEEYSPSPQLPASAVGGLAGAGVAGAGAGAGRRPLPMPPPSRPGSRNANHGPAGPRVNSPLRSAPARAINDRTHHSHTRSRSDVELSLDNMLSPQQSEKSIGYEGAETDPDPVDPESLPYHERSAKWKGKQKMRDLPPSPTSPTSSLLASSSPEDRTKSSPVFMSDAFPTNSLRQTHKPAPSLTVHPQPRNSPSLPTLNLSYQQKEVTSQPVHSASATTTSTVIPPPPPLPVTNPFSANDPSALSIVTNTHLSSMSPPAIPPYPTGVDLPPSLSSYKSPISAKSTVTSGGISKRIIKRSGSVSSIRSNSSWRSSKSGHSTHGQWSANKFAGKDKEHSASANSSPVVPGLGSVSTSNGMFNYDNNYSSYTPTTPHSAKQPPTPRLQIPTTPSFVPPPPALPVAPNPTTARLPLPPPPSINTAVQPTISLTPPANTPSQNPSSRKNTKTNKYFIANRTSMESIASLAVSVQGPGMNGSAGSSLGSVDSFASNTNSNSSGSGGSAVTVDAAPGALYGGSVARHSQESFSTYSTRSDSTTSSLIKSDDTPDTPTFQEDIGHAHDGYDVDDDRVYIDSGGGDVDLEELEDLGEFQAAPGSPDENASEDSDWDTGVRRVKGGMSFARALGDGDSDQALDSRGTSRYTKEKSKDKQKGKGKERSKGKEKEKKKEKDNRRSKVKATMNAIEEYVYINGGVSLPRSTTAISKGRASPPLPAIPPPMPASRPQHQPALPLSPPPPELTGEVLDDPEDILGGETEMVFATGSESRRGRGHGQNYVLGLGGVGLDHDDHEDQVYVRGKWRMRSLSPVDQSPLSSSLRRYQSEESLHGSFEDERAHMMPVHAEAPVRLAPNRYIELPEQRLAFSPIPPPIDAPIRSKSHQARSSVSIPPTNVQTAPIPSVHKPLPQHVLNHDYTTVASASAVNGGAGAFVGSAGYQQYTFANQDTTPKKNEKERESMSSSGAFMGAGGTPAPFVFLNSDKKEKERSDTNSIRSKQSTKPKSGATIKRGLSMPGEPPKEHVRRQLDSLAPKQVSYEVWVERGLGAAPELPRKKLTKAQT